MIIKRTGLLLLLLAYLVMLGHAFIPHHHHTGSDDLDHHHMELHNHHHDEVPSGDLSNFFTHLIHADLVFTQTTNFRINHSSNDSFQILVINFVNSIYLFENSGSTILYTPPPEPYIPNSPFLCLSGLRAPPFHKS